MIQVTALQLEIALGRFHRVVHIAASQQYLEVQDSTGTLFLVPLYPIRGHKIEVLQPYPLPKPPAASSVVHLDHLEIHNVTRINIQPNSLKIETAPGLIFQWKVYAHVFSLL